MEASISLFSLLLSTHLGGTDSCNLAYDSLCIPLYDSEKLPGSWNRKILHVILTLTAWTPRACPFIPRVWGKGSVFCLIQVFGFVVCLFICLFVLNSVWFSWIPYSVMIYSTEVSCPGQSYQHCSSLCCFFSSRFMEMQGGAKYLFTFFLCFMQVPSYLSVPRCAISQKIPSYTNGDIHPLIIQWKIQQIVFYSQVV